MKSKLKSASKKNTDLLKDRSDGLHSVLHHRLSGILLHPSSLPGGYGIGDIGQSSYEFVDYLNSAKQKIWQVLPIGPTIREEYHCPYASVSAFAGNPLLLSIDELVKNGLISQSEVNRRGGATLRKLNSTKVDFKRVEDLKLPILEEAARNFVGARAEKELSKFTKQHPWVSEYAEYAALREHFGTKRVKWPQEFRFKSAASRAKLNKIVGDEDVRVQVVLQYLFFKQWQKLRSYAASKGIYLFGDLPIYVSNDSADVWAHPEYFEVDRKTGLANLVSGVPPDMFNSNGQLWGYPVYNWKSLKSDRFSWWIERVRTLRDFFDIVRIDHFRGFESFWAVKGDAKVAKFGKWIECPGVELFKALKKEFKELPFFAEDLGIITPPVEALRDDFGLLGTKVLQFAFGDNPAEFIKSPYHPVNIPVNSVVYTGTHDNPSSREWFTTLPKVSQKKLRGLLNDCAESEVADQLLRLVMSLRAQICIVPLQDLLGLGRGSRMNYPGTASWKNWSWRVESLPASAAAKMAHLSDVFDRN